VAELEKLLSQRDGDAQRYLDTILEQEKRIAELEAALENYSRRGHHDTCDAALDCGNFECNCGLREAEAALKGE
jgi:hypothetical protein